MTSPAFSWHRELSFSFHPTLLTGSKLQSVEQLRFLAPALGDDGRESILAVVGRHSLGALMVAAALGPKGRPDMHYRRPIRRPSVDSTEITV